MTLPSVELLLVLAVVALYLQDSAMLLHYDEIAVVRRGEGWSASTGANGRLHGRYLYLPNPLRPGAALFRCGWLSGPAPAPREHWAGWRHFVAALAGFAPGCWLLGSLLMVALPVLLWRMPHPLLMLALAAAIYGTVAAIGWRLWRYRRVLELSGRQALSLAFELLCCPPHAINVVRRLCARRGLRGNAFDAAERLLSPARTQAIAGEIGERLSMAMDFHGDEPRLVEAKQRLDGLR
jgi:hypothetical protein